MSRRLTLALILIAASLRPAAAQSTPWPRDFEPVVAAFWDGRFDDVRLFCREQLHADDAARRREAHLLQTLVALRDGSRNERSDALGYIDALAVQEPPVAARPEVLLAEGAARAFIYSTSRALRCLHAARVALDAAGQRERWAVVTLEMARTWARHAEWEFPVAELDTPVPDTPEKAQAERARRIQALRDELRQHGLDQAAAEAGLILAHLLREAPESSGDGEALLARLAEGDLQLRPACQAALELAQLLDQRGEAASAATLYQRAADTAHADLAGEAQRRLAALRRPRLELALPQQGSVDAAGSVTLTVRNADAARLEVRRVDLADWITARRGEMDESRLPRSGSLAAQRAWNPPAGQAADSAHAELAIPLSELSAGAYAVLAGARRGGAETSEARLLIVSALKLAVIPGHDRFVVWSPSPAGADATVRFWVQGALAPATPRMADGVAAFDLPPEARIMRSRRWTCLVQAGDQLALCSGELPQPSGREPLPEVALWGGPNELAAGDTFRLAGIVLGDPPRRAARFTGRLEVLWQDTYGETIARQTVGVTPDGLFGWELPITPDLAGRAGSIVVRQDGQALTTVTPRLALTATPDGASRGGIEFSAPRWLPDQAEFFEGVMTAEWAPGSPAAGRPAAWALHTVRLPTAAPRAGFEFPLLDRDDGTTGAAGEHFLQHSRAKLTLPGPLALTLRASVNGPDLRVISGSTSALWGPAPAHVWVSRPDSLRVGEPADLWLTWFDPQGLGFMREPSLTLTPLPDGTPVSLALRRSARGFDAAPWRPAAAAAYRLRAELPLATGAPAVWEETVDVEQRLPDAAEPPFEIVAEPARPASPAVTAVALQVRSSGDRPLLALLCGRDPIAAAAVPAGGREVEASLALGGPRCDSAHVRLVDWSASGPRVVAVAPLTLAATALQAEVVAADPAGAFVDLRLAAEEDVTSVLVRVAGASSGPWSPTPLLPQQFTEQADARIVANAPSPDRAWPPPPEHALVSAYYEGVTLAAVVLPREQLAEPVRIALPDWPAPRGLVLAARTRSGATVVQRVPLADAAALRIRVSGPPRMLIGDRLPLQVRLRNMLDRPLSGRLTLDAGAGFRVERTSTSAPADANTGGWQITLAPGETRQLRINGEATVAGDGEALAEWRGEGMVQAARHVYQVEGLAVPEAQPEIRIERTLLRAAINPAAQPDDPFDTISNSDPLAGSTRTVLSADDSVRPGDLLIVRERVTFSRPLRDVRWRQRMPSHCVSLGAESAAVRSLGAREERQASVIEYRCAELTDVVEHEYAIVAQFEGVAELPAPQVFLGAQSLATETAEELRIRVVSPGTGASGPTP